MNRLLLYFVFAGAVLLFVSLLNKVIDYRFYAVLALFWLTTLALVLINLIK